MTFKTILPVNSCPALPGFSVLQLQGPDAAAFLQAQTMNDAAALADGGWHWNGWLTPKGRVVALFALLRLASDRFLMVLPDFPASELQPLLQRFVFRSKLALRADTGLVAAAGPHQSTPGPDVAIGDIDSGLALDFGTATLPRSLYLLPSGHPALAPADAGTGRDWLATDLAHGLPRLPLAQREAWTPQMLALERLSAYSLRKGCYPGQEIVARTHYLGKAKRSLLRLAGEGLVAGDEVHDGEASAGTLVCAREDGLEALAVVSGGEGLHWSVKGRPCTRLDLLPGLNRSP